VRVDPAEIPSPFDLVFVAVKATQVKAAAPWLSVLCSEKTVVCVLQNGIEQKALFAPYLPGESVLPSVVWFPAQSEPDASVWLRGKARLSLPDVPASRVVLAALSDTRCSVDVSADFTSVACES
jgi:2-dehydropantoate 2-reductase